MPGAVLASETVSPIFSDDMVDQVKAQLGVECGEDRDACLKTFDEIYNFATAASPDGVSVDKFVKTLTDTNQQMLKSYSKKMDKLSIGKLSFLQERALARSRDRGETIDQGVPCWGSTSCTVLSTVWNACNYGRLLTMTAYQSNNIVAHILTVMESLLCGCVYLPVVTQGFCLMRHNVFFPTCGVISTAAQFFANSVSKSLWQGVAGVTRKCQLHEPSALMMAKALR